MIVLAFHDQNLSSLEANPLLNPPLHVKASLDNNSSMTLENNSNSNYFKKVWKLTANQLISIPQSFSKNGSSHVKNESLT